MAFLPCTSVHNPVTSLDGRCAAATVVSGRHNGEHARDSHAARKVTSPGRAVGGTRRVVAAVARHRGRAARTAELSSRCRWSRRTRLPRPPAPRWRRLSGRTTPARRNRFSSIPGAGGSSMTDAPHLDRGRRGQPRHSTMSSVASSVVCPPRARPSTVCRLSLATRHSPPADVAHRAKPVCRLSLAACGPPPAPRPCRRGPCQVCSVGVVAVSRAWALARIRSARGLWIAFSRSAARSQLSRAPARSPRSFCAVARWSSTSAWL